MQLWFAEIHSILGIPQFLPSFLYLQSRDCADSELTDRKPVAPEAPGHPVPWGKSCWQTQCHPALRGGTGHWNANTGHGFARCRTYYLHSIRNTGHAYSVHEALWRKTVPKVKPSQRPAPGTAVDGTEGPLDSCPPSRLGGGAWSHLGTTTEQGGTCEVFLNIGPVQHGTCWAFQFCRWSSLPPGSGTETGQKRAWSACLQSFFKAVQHW